MRIKTIEDDDSFLSLKEDWDRLAENYSTVNTFDWMIRWWKHFGYGNDLKILVAEDNGKVLGIAPLYIENTTALKNLPLKKLCFLGGEISDYLDFLIVQDERLEFIFKTIIEFILANIKYDILELNQIHSNLPNFDLWQKYSGILGFKFYEFNKCPGITISDFSSYEEFHKHLGKKFREVLRTRINRCKKDNINFEFVFKKNISKNDIEEIGKLNHDRQKFLYNKGDMKRFCYFLDQKKNDFILDYFCSSDIDSKMLACMKLDGEIVSYIMILFSKRAMYCWNTAFKSDLDRYSPTKLLINELIKYAYENNYKYFDFMRGTNPYKLEWTEEMALNYNLLYYKSLKAKLISLYRENAPESLLKRVRTCKNLVRG